MFTNQRMSSDLYRKCYLAVISLSLLEIKSASNSSMSRSSPVYLICHSHVCHWQIRREICPSFDVVSFGCTDLAVTCESFTPFGK